MRTHCSAPRDLTALRQRAATLRAELAAACAKKSRLAEAIETRTQTLNRLEAAIAMNGSALTATTPDE